jgi:hypothetical protein
VKSKDQALDSLQEYVRWMRSLGYEMTGKGCVLQADNDGAYTSQRFREWCGEQGIRQQFSAPHTQAQNGVAERAWNTLVDTARTLLTAARLPKPYWGFALKHAALVRSMVPSSALTGGGSKVPFQRLFGTEPDLSQLRVFGCPAFVHVERDARKKWDPKARQGVYVGRSLESKTHLVFFPETHTLVQSMHVDFDETAPVAGEGVSAAGSKRAPATKSVSVLVRAPSVQPQQPSHDTDSEVSAVSESGDDTATDFEPDSPASPAPGPKQFARDPLLDSFEDDINVMLSVRDALVTALSAHAQVGDPKSYSEAMAGPDADKWAEATLEECQSILENNTWTLVPRSTLRAGARAMRSKFIYKTKHDSDGGIERYKARLVVQGCSQREGIDYDEVFAPVAHHETIRVALAVAASSGMVVHQMDVKTAFLIPEVSEELYMELPDGWPSELPGKRADSVCRLNKALYGLKQAPRYWNQRLNAWMLSQHFERSLCDSCLYIKTLADGSRMYVTVWVDDLLIMARSLVDIELFKTAISSEFKMKDLGPAHFCLGMRIRSESGSLRLDQQRYIEDVLQRFKMADCNPVGTPLPPHTVLEPAKTSGGGDGLLGPDGVLRFREITGSLMYMVACTRPDLAVAVNQLARHMAAPTTAHMQAAKHVLRYLRGTAAWGLSYKGAGDVDSTNTAVGYADATWGSVEPNKRSVTGYVFVLNGAAVSWKCKVQHCVALSTTEAEYLSLCEATREAAYLRNLLSELGLEQHKPTVIFEDNQPCIHLVSNPVTISRAKHIAIRLNFVRERLQDQTIKVMYCPTQNMAADALTKILPKPQHRKLCTLLMGEELE